MTELEAAPLKVKSIIRRLLEVRGSKPGKSVDLTESEIRGLCLKSREIFLSQPILLDLEAPLKICGDIHGQYFDLLELFEYGGFPPESSYLFLGNYVDKGIQSLETICLLLAYKIRYPKNFFLLRGNHECASLNREHGFYDECKRRYNIRLWKTFTDCFNCLPVAAIVDEKIFCCHGGLSPDLQSMEQIRRIMRPTDVPDQGLLCDLLWADPDKETLGWGENDRGVSFTFGTEVVSKFLTKHELDLICRSHQVVEYGYEFFAKRQLVTLFSAPNFCGEYDNAGAMMSVDETLMCSFQILKPQDKIGKLAPKTSLYDAAANGHAAMVETLLKSGADVNEGRSTTPLHIAAEKGHYDVVAVLLSHNADGTIKDEEGRTALDLMTQKYKEDFAPLFVKKSGEPVTKMSELWQKLLSAQKQTLLLLQKGASIAEERNATADTSATDACVSDTQIAKAASEGSTSELQIHDLTAQCRHLQEQLDKASAPSWVLNKVDIVLTDKELGRGGWGVVRAARFCGLDVAAKLLHGAILSPHNQQLFMREMNIAAMVRHPNIVLFIGATMDQECIILTELMQTSLRAVLEEKKANKLKLSHQQVSKIAMDVGKALNYLHLMKPDAIIHRDVSSANVLLEQLEAEMWKAKLSDFGSSNFARQVATVAPGNFTYAAPESADPDLQSPKMDVFSYGILLLEMSIGHFPEIQKRQELIQKLTWSAMKALIVESITRDLKCRPSMADVLTKLNSMHSIV